METDQLNKIKNVDDIENETNSSNEVPEEPFKKFCKNCSKDVTTFVNKDAHPLSFVLSIVLLYFYGVWALPAMCVVIPLLRTLTHLCPYCQDLLVKKTFYPIKQKDEFIMLQYGKCIIIMRKLYIFLIIFAYIFLGTYINVQNMLHPQQPAHVNTIDKSMEKFYYTEIPNTWDEVIQDCGASVILENSAKAHEVFKKKYFKRIVTWKGYFISAFASIPMFGMQVPREHFLNLNIRMVPSESLNSPDLFVSVHLDLFKKHDPLFRSLRDGDPIKFKAVFEDIGTEWQAHHFHLIEIEKTEDFIDHDKKVLLFKGVTINITGHYKNKEQENHSLVIEKNVASVVDKFEKEHGSLELDETKLNSTGSEEKREETTETKHDTEIKNSKGNKNDDNPEVEKKEDKLKYLEEEKKLEPSTESTNKDKKSEELKEVEKAKTEKSENTGKAN